MCRLFPCILILRVFIFYFFLKKTIMGWGFRSYHVPCPGSLHFTVVFFEIDYWASGKNLLFHRFLHPNVPTTNNYLYFFMLETLNNFTKNHTIAVVEIMVGHQLKLIKNPELPTKKVTENSIFTNHFVIFYCLHEDWLVIFYFFKELQVFLFLLIPFFIFHDLQ